MSYNVFKGDKMIQDKMTAGELAKQVNVIEGTLQYYDKISLLKLIELEENLCILLFNLVQQEMLHILHDY